MNLIPRWNIPVSSDWYEFRLAHDYRTVIDMNGDNKPDFADTENEATESTYDVIYNGRVVRYHLRPYRRTREIRHRKCEQQYRHITPASGNISGRGSERRRNRFQTTAYETITDKTALHKARYSRLFLYSQERNTLPTDVYKRKCSG